MIWQGANSFDFPACKSDVYCSTFLTLKQDLSFFSTIFLLSFVAEEAKLQNMEYKRQDALRFILQGTYYAKFAFLAVKCILLLGLSL